MNTDPVRWERLKGLFDRAVELPAAERKEFLSALKIEDETLFDELYELIAVDEAAAAVLDETDEGDAAASLIGTSIGSYRIVRELGRGGMGTVFEGLREDGDFEKRVAIKLTGRSIFSDDLIRRFRNEKQILARLEHPNIVRLLDGGITATHVPYYVMEFVGGVPITQFAEANSLDTRSRLKLFLQVTDAVAYAHRQLVVHRDLKPSNILVTPEGNVKLLDFGIAKGLDDVHQTLTMGVPMTPDYASPEQIKGDVVSTGSDVYSLGVLLFELLTGLKPAAIYGEQKQYFHRAILETDPLKPSEAVTRMRRNYGETQGYGSEDVARGLTGDIDNIILHCLEKTPESRYPTVDGLAGDIRAFLEGMPVAAHPQSRAYRWRKYARRNAMPLAAAAAALLLIFAGSGAAVYQSTVAREQQQLAEARFQQVRKVANALIFDYHDEIAKLEGSTALREKLVTDAVAYLDAIASEEIDDPQLLFELGVAYRKIGDVLGAPYEANLGRLDEAIENYQKSVAILDGRLARFPRGEDSVVEMVESYRSLAMAELRSRGKEQAGQTSLVALEKLETNSTGLSESRALKLLHLRMLLSIGGTVSWDIHKARTFYQKGFDEAEALLSIDPADDEIRFLAGKFNQRMSSSYRWGVEQGTTVSASEISESYELALMHAQKYVEHFTTIKDLRPRELADAYLNLSYNLISLGRHDEALKWIAEAEAKIDTVKVRDPNNAEIRLDELGSYNARRKILTARGELHETKRLIDMALDAAIRYSVEDPRNIEALSWVGHFAKEGSAIARKLDDQNAYNRYQQLFDNRAEMFRSLVGSEWSGHFGF